MKARNHSEASSSARSAVKTGPISSFRPPAEMANRARWFKLDNALPPLILTPAMIASIVFVYAFIAIMGPGIPFKMGDPAHGPQFARTVRLHLPADVFDASLARQPSEHVHLYSPFSDRVALFSLAWF